MLEDHAAEPPSTHTDHGAAIACPATSDDDEAASAAQADDYTVSADANGDDCAATAGTREENKAAEIALSVTECSDAKISRAIELGRAESQSDAPRPDRTTDVDGFGGDDGNDHMWGGGSRDDGRTPRRLDGMDASMQSVATDDASSSTGSSSSLDPSLVASTCVMQFKESGTGPASAPLVAVSMASTRLPPVLPPRP